MKLERLGQDKIRIFLTFDDLTERGIQKDDMWQDIPKVHELFNEMMDQAYSELGFEVAGPVAVEVFALPAQGMVVIVTRSKSSKEAAQEELDDDLEDVLEVEVTLETCDMISYAFHQIDDFIAASKIMMPYVPEASGELFFYRGKYVYQLEPSEIVDETNFQPLISILSEFGETYKVTRAMLEEYGKKVASQAVHVFNRHF